MQAGLWGFSLDFYARPGVASACLRCQDEAGADVNLVLFLLWQGQAGTAFTSAEIAAIDQHVRRWREEVVQPLRAIRRALANQGQDSLREKVKAAELEAEHLELDTLFTHACASGGTAANAASANLHAYAALLPAPLPPEAVVILQRALDG